jgi:hypothetical protein
MKSVKSEDQEYLDLMDRYDEKQMEVDKLKKALNESQHNDKIAMYYLTEIRKITGGNSYPESIEIIKTLFALTKDDLELIYDILDAEGSLHTSLKTIDVLLKKIARLLKHAPNSQR